MRGYIQFALIVAAMAIKMVTANMPRIPRNRIMKL
ncbi:hypothetical protein LINPERHAP2_LOCUS4366 [Linum perenne]